MSDNYPVYQGNGDVDDFGICVLYKGSFDLDKEEFYQNRGFIIKDERISFAAECDATTILVMFMPADILEISNWRVHKLIKDPQSGNDDKRFLTLLPGKDLSRLPFMISSGRESLNLINGER